MQKTVVITALILFSPHAHSMRPLNQLTKEQQKQKDIELERRMEAMRAEQAQRTTHARACENDVPEGYIATTQLSMHTVHNATEEDFDAFFQEQRAQHVTDEEIYSAPATANEYETQEQRDAALEKRMAAMRLEQSQRPVQQQTTSNIAFTGTTYSQRVADVPGIGKVNVNEVNFGNEGIPVDELIRRLKKAAEESPRNPSHCPTATILMTAVGTPEYIEEMTKKGYLHKTLSDSLHCYYLPGHEPDNNAYKHIHNRMRDELNK